MLHNVYIKKNIFKKCQKHQGKDKKGKEHGVGDVVMIQYFSKEMKMITYSIGPFRTNIKV